MTEGHVTDLSMSGRPVTHRAHQFVPAIILFAAGLAVTFTQVLHEVLSFNSGVVAVFGVLYGASLLLAPQLGGVRNPETTVLGVASLVTGGAAPFMPSAAALGLLLLVWAAVSAVTHLWRWATTRERDARAIAVFGALLAIALAFGARDLPGVMGFFAAYCIVVGVYAGIATFDRNEVAGEPQA